MRVQPCWRRPAIAIGSKAILHISLEGTYTHLHISLLHLLELLQAIESAIVFADQFLLESPSLKQQEVGFHGVDCILELFASQKVIVHRKLFSECMDISSGSM